MALAPLIELESPWSREFDDARTEWRRLFSEFLGTFMLVLAGAGGAVVDAASGGQIGRGAGVTAPGLMVLAVILFMGTVSGAHLNPAVTLAFALRGDFPWRRVPGYIVVQLVAAVAACLVLRLIFGDVGGLGATLPGAGFTDWQGGDTAGRGFHRLAGGGRRAAADRRPGQHDPGHCLLGAERRSAVGPRRRWLHRAGRSVVQSGERSIDEPGALVRARAGHRRLQRVLGVPGRAAAGRGDRGRDGLSAARPGRRCLWPGRGTRRAAGGPDDPQSRPAAPRVMTDPAPSRCCRPSSPSDVSDQVHPVGGMLRHDEARLWKSAGPGPPGAWT